MHTVVTKRGGILRVVVYVCSVGYMHPPLGGYSENTYIFLLEQNR